MLGDSWVADQLVASQEGLSIMELIISKNLSQGRLQYKVIFI
jgi:hypothetical protein